VVKGNFRIPWLGNVLSVEHKLEIETQDGRYRYTLEYFVGVLGTRSWPLEDKGFRNTKLIERTAQSSESLLTALKAAMSQDPKNW
jgi:hypothetical protein